MGSSEPYILDHTTLVKGAELLQNGTLVVDAGIITYAGSREGFPGNINSPVMDGRDWLIAPGFIDLQINGGFGHDFSVDPGSIQPAAERLPETGTTAFLPTFVSSRLSQYRTMLEAVLSIRREVYGARVLGAHIEGPFLNYSRRGAHNPDWLCVPDLNAHRQIAPLEAVSMITLAPEVAHGLEAVQWFARRGIVVAVGHSEAITGEAIAALEAGSTYATHLFNAMPPLNHSEPGLVGILLTSSEVRCGLIADGIHVHSRAVRLAWQCLGAGGLTLATDAMSGMGMPQGTYTLGDQPVIVNEKGARLPGGRLAGSLLRMDEAVRNVLAFTGCSIPAAVRMASTTPAAVLNLDGHMGRLEPGYLADFILLNKTLHVDATVVAGKCIYANSAARERLAILCKP